MVNKCKNRMVASSPDCSAPICSRCKNKPIIELKYVGLRLCKNCFMDYFEKRVKKTVSEIRYTAKKSAKRTEGRDKIAVALSGGKDSTVLLYILSKIAYPKPFAITIDGGIKGYDDKLIKNAKALCKKLGVVHHVFSFKNEFDYTIDDLAKARPGLCNCGIFRRYLLNKKARELGATKLATGHNLDDEAESFLMNVMRGDVDRIMRSRGMIEDEKFVQRIKPLQKCPENEVLLYAKLVFPKMNFGITCPYKKDVLRGSIKKMIDELEEKHSGIKFQIYEGNIRIRDALLKTKGKIETPNTCKKCGEIAAGDVCQTCTLKEEIRRVLDQKD